MRTSPYYKRASKRFLAGTRFNTPSDAVNAGAKTLREWTQILEEERHNELQVAAQRMARHVPNHKRVARAART
jgi:exonuclease VII large subunit